MSRGHGNGAPPAPSSRRYGTIRCATHALPSNLFPNGPSPALAPAHLRVLVSRILCRHGHPPDRKRLRLPSCPRVGQSIEWTKL